MLRTETTELIQTVQKLDDLLNGSGYNPGLVSLINSLGRRIELLEKDQEKLMEYFNIRFVNKPATREIEETTDPL